MGGHAVFAKIEPHLQTLPDGIALVDDVAKATGCSWEQVRDALYNNTRSKNAKTKKISDKIYVYLPTATGEACTPRLKAVRGTERFPFWDLSGDPLCDYALLRNTLSAAFDEAVARLTAHDPHLIVGNTAPTVHISISIPVTQS